MAIPVPISGMVTGIHLCQIPKSPYGNGDPHMETGDASIPISIRQRATTQPVAVTRPEDERRRRCNKWGVASCDNQLAEKRLRQSCKADSATEQQQRRRDNQLANKRQTGGEAFKRQTGNGR